VGYRAHHWNLRTTQNLELPHLTEGGAEQAAAAERQRKNWQNSPTPGKTKTELLLKYQHQDWMLKE
jgi:hypothetical protein